MADPLGDLSAASGDQGLEQVETENRAPASRPPGPVSSKAFDFAQDMTKQVLTLSTGIITITLTFLSDKIGTYSHLARHLLELGWLAYLISILFGLLMLMALTGNLERPNARSGAPTIYAGNVRALSGVQLVMFLAGTVLVGWFATKIT
jgi:hypothetical protein